MGIKDFLKKVNDVADEPYRNKFDKKLNGAHIFNEKKVCNCLRYLDGEVIDIEGNIIEKYDFKYLGVFNSKYYVAQENYESKNWGLFDRKNKKKIWLKSNPIHHEIYFDKTNIFVLDKECKKYKNRLVEFDVVKEYNLKGKLISSWSSYSNLKDLQKWHNKLPLDIPKFLFLNFASKKHLSPWGAEYDYYHFNSFQIIPKNNLNDKRFKEGNWLISCRHGSIIFILDKDSKKVVWSISQKDIKDEIQGQHSVQILNNGNMLIFDNGRYRGWSRIIEINPITLEIVWEYKDKDFFTSSQGYVQVLSNKNYLITQSEKGRVFEITKNKELVWEYFIPKKYSKKNCFDEKTIGLRKWIYRCIFLS